jgi:hypothetical protein
MANSVGIAVSWKTAMVGTNAEVEACTSSFLTLSELGRAVG